MLDFVEVDATKLAWRMDMAEIRCLDSVEVDATKLAWRIDVAEIRCSDSVEVDAWNFAWRFGVAENSKLGFLSLDSTICKLGRFIMGNNGFIITHYRLSNNG